jgi:hypothetical protein
LEAEAPVGVSIGMEKSVLLFLESIRMSLLLEAVADLHFQSLTPQREVEEGLALKGAANQNFDPMNPKLCYYPLNHFSSH